MPVLLGVSLVLEVPAVEPLPHDATRLAVAVNRKAFRDKDVFIDTPFDAAAGVSTPAEDGRRQASPVNRSLLAPIIDTLSYF
jgi:hypothetical protein